MSGSDGPEDSNRNLRKRKSAPRVDNIFYYGTRDEGEESFEEFQS